MVFRDRVRSRFLLAISALFLLVGLTFASDVDAAADRIGVFAVFGLIAGACAQAARLGVEVRDEGIKLRSYFRNRSVAWSEISYFGREEMPGRFTSVPVVVLQNGRKIVMYGLDSVFSGFGASSPLWDEAVALLSDELSRRRMARWD